VTGIMTRLTEAAGRLKLEPREPVQLDLIDFINRLPKPEPPDPILRDGRAYYIGYLGGRCASGSEGGAGTLNHVVPTGPVRFCAARPGYHSNGFVRARPGAEVTCPRCAKKLQRMSLEILKK